MPGWVIGLIVVGCVASVAITAIAIKLVRSENKHFLDNWIGFQLIAGKPKPKQFLFLTNQSQKLK